MHTTGCYMVTFALYENDYISSLPLSQPPKMTKVHYLPLMLIPLFRTSGLKQLILDTKSL